MKRGKVPAGKLFSLILLAALLGGGTLCWGQADSVLSLQAAARTISVDPYSFAPNLVLRHSYGRFYRLPKNPVLEPHRGAWDAKDAADPYVVVVPEGIFLFYDGDSDGRYRLGWARRDREGWGWLPGGRIDLPAAPAWAAYHQIAPVLVFTGRRWWLFFAGNNSDLELGYRIGALVGSPPDSWQLRQSEPLIRTTSGEWDFAGINYADVLYDGQQQRFRMWYTGFQGPLAGIGYAESSDGIHWRKLGSGPVFALAPGVIAPEVVFNGRDYVMFVIQLFSAGGGLQTRIIRTRSLDGLNWQSPETVLEPAEKWEGKRLMRPNLSFFEGRIHLSYCAQKGSHWRIGEAVAEARFDTLGLWQSPWQAPASGKLILTYELARNSGLRAAIRLKGRSEPLPLNLNTVRRTLRQHTFRSEVPLPAATTASPWQLELILLGDGTSSPLVFPPVIQKSR
ncbi:MAG: hypothetical protein D6715_14005 [Calditrichaeota bacterium]|nr:MAG: hypothetical protein D6715_14005 [Calditrichota bacterium]